MTQGLLGANNFGTNAPGSGGSPGLLGTGMYQYTPQQIQQSAFNNPLGNVAPQLGASINSITSAAPTATAATSSYTGQGTQGQLGLAQQYAQMAAGNGPSLASVQAQQQGAQNLAGAESMLGSARGAGSPAAAQLAAQNAQTQGAQQVAQNAVAGRTAEELGALGAAGSLYGQVAGTGLSQQGQQNQVGLSNAQMQQQAQQAQLQALITENAQQQQGAQSGQQLAVQNQLGTGQIQSAAYNNAAQNNAALASGVLKGVSGLAGVL